MLLKTYPFMDQGEAERHVGENAMNARSGRSHTISRMVRSGHCCTICRVGKFLKSLKGAVNILFHFFENYMKFFRHYFFSSKSEWRCNFFVFFLII